MKILIRALGMHFIGPSVTGAVCILYTAARCYHATEFGVCNLVALTMPEDKKACAFLFSVFPKEKEIEVISVRVY